MSSQDDSQLDRPVSDWLLERLARGELSPERAAEVRRRLEAEGEAGVERLAALERSDQEILAAHPPAVVAAEIRRRAAVAEVAAAQRVSRPATTWRFALPALAVGTMAALLLFAPGAPVKPPYNGIKGGPKPQLAVHLKKGTRSQRLPAGASVKPGEQLQLSYVAGGRRYGVVASVDARGGVTLHLPEAAGQASSLARLETKLPHAFELDDSPGAERFVFVSGDQPFSTDVVAEALRPGGAPLPDNLTLIDLTLQRTPRDSGNTKDKP
jgi:hypothetical protein